MTEIIIVSSDESNSFKEKNDFQENLKTKPVEKIKIQNVTKNNKPTKSSMLKLNDKNNNAELKSTMGLEDFEEKNLEENLSSKKDISNEITKTENFVNKNKANFSEKSLHQKILQSSASYKIGSENNPHPNYPLLARKKGWEGRVIIQVNIDKAGNVKFIKILESSGFKVLDDVSVETLKTWKFKPAKLGNSFVDDIVNIPVKFVLSN